MPKDKGKARAARSLAVLWAFTSLLYFLHPQGAIPLVTFFGSGEKWPSVLASLFAASAVLLNPSGRAALAAAFLVSSLSVLAWHSWLGAYQPLVPAGFLFLLVFRRESAIVARRALLDSLALGLVAGALHRLNPEFLGGQELMSGGTLYRDLPFQQWFASNAVFWSWAWLLAGLAPVPFLLKGSRAGWWLLAISAVFSVVLYKVLFYGFFLLIPALFLWDSSFLLRWRMGERALRPCHLYLAGLIGFVLWYLVARDNYFVYLLAVGASGGAALASTYSPEKTSALLSPFSQARIFWGVAWLSFLVLPIFVTQIPAPFGLTQFSSREVRYPPAESTLGWKGLGDCAELKSSYALRWGYRVWPDSGGCRLQFYRRAW